MFCGDSDITFSVYVRRVADCTGGHLVGVCCVRSRGAEVPDTISLDCFVRAAQTALLTRSGRQRGGGDAGRVAREARAGDVSVR